MNPAVAASADPAAVVRRWYAARDPDLLDPEVVWRVLPAWPEGGERRGRTAVTEAFFPDLVARFERYGVEPDGVFAADGERVVTTGRYIGRARGAATDFSAAFVHLWTVRDGRIVRFEQVADTFALLGTLPAEGQ